MHVRTPSRSRAGHGIIERMDALRVSMAAEPGNWALHARSGGLRTAVSGTTDSKSSVAIRVSRCRESREADAVAEALVRRCLFCAHHQSGSSTRSFGVACSSRFYLDSASALPHRRVDSRRGLLASGRARTGNEPSAHRAQLPVTRLTRPRNQPLGIESAAHTISSERRGDRDRREPSRG